MLGTGIKNAILILLIILIVHVVVKNMLKTQREKFVAELPYPTPMIASKFTSRCHPILPPPPPPKPPLQCQYNHLDHKDDEKEKLLNFVFGEKDKPNGEKSLDDFFKEFTKQQIQLPPPPSQQSVKNPPPSTCDMNIQELSLSADEMERNYKPLVKDHDKKQIQIINDYKNENEMNGGDPLFCQVHAFDDFNIMQYSQL